MLNWMWYAEIRTAPRYPEEANRADGWPVTSLVVNSNLGEAKFEATEKWRCHIGQRNYEWGERPIRAKWAQPLGTSAERKIWTCHIGHRAEFCLPLSFTISSEKTHIHQEIGQEASRLRDLGWSYVKIARRLGETDKTAKKAVSRS